MKKESKPCLICGKTIARSIDHTDHSWMIKMYCNLDCQMTAFYMRHLEKKGYKVIKK